MDAYVLKMRMCDDAYVASRRPFVGLCEMVLHLCWEFPDGAHTIWVHFGTSRPRQPEAVQFVMSCDDLVNIYCRLAGEPREKDWMLFGQASHDRWLFKIYPQLCSKPIRLWVWVEYEE